MGLWNFVKGAGKSIGSGAAEAAEATPKSENLMQEIEDLGLDIEDLQIAVDGDTVRLTGRTASQAEREKAILALGNVEGVAKVEEDIETPESGQEPVFHTVAEGETLRGIAEEHLDAAARYQEILDANKPMLIDPNLIYPGQVLRIPTG